VWKKQEWNKQAWNIAMANVPKPDNRELVSASLKLLAMRDMSRMQFEEKMAKREFSPEEIAEAVAWCEAEGWLNESRYAEVAARRLGQKYGATRVAQTLRQKGVNDEAVAQAIADMADTEFSRARNVWARKFDAIPESAEVRSKQTRYLQSRGFSFAIIKRVLSGEPGGERDEE
jgi:regulatory protein